MSNTSLEEVLFMADCTENDLIALLALGFPPNKHHKYSIEL